MSFSTAVHPLDRAVQMHRREPSARPWLMTSQQNADCKAFWTLCSQSLALQVKSLCCSALSLSFCWPQKTDWESGYLNFNPDIWPLQVKQFWSIKRLWGFRNQRDMSFFLGKVIVVLRHPAARNVGGETPLTKGIKASKYAFVVYYIYTFNNGLIRLLTKSSKTTILHLLTKFWVTLIFSGKFLPVADMLQFYSKCWLFPE